MPSVVGKLKTIFINLFLSLARKKYQKAVKYDIDSYDSIMTTRLGEVGYDS